MSDAGNTKAIEALAAEIGDVLYMDIAKWHLYLSNAHLHIPLAERLYPMLQERLPSESDVETVLQGMPVAIGGNKHFVSLAQLVPNACIPDLIRCLEDYRRENF